MAYGWVTITHYARVVKSLLKDRVRVKSEKKVKKKKVRLINV